MFCCAQEAGAVASDSCSEAISASMQETYRLLQDHQSSPDGAAQAMEHNALTRKTSSFDFATSQRRPMICTAAVVESEQFKQFIGMIISLSLVVLAGETDYDDWAVWQKVDTIILLIFIVEMGLKVQHKGLYNFFMGVDRFWNYLECIIVFFGLLEMVLWLCSRFTSSVPEYPNLRLTRLLRLVRLFRLVKPLNSLVTAYRTMLETFTIVFTVLFLLLLVGGIFCTYLLGHGESLDMEDELVQANFKDIELYFRDLPTSMFTLFQVCTLDNWIDIAQPVISCDVRWQIFFIIFIPIASWTMISIMAAVASESVVESAMGRAEAQKKDEEDMRRSFLSFLREAFVQADADGNGLLDKEEFLDLIHKDEVIERMKMAGESSLSPEDLLSVWDSLDSNGVGELTIDEFVSGFALLSEGLSAKHIATFDYALQKASVKVLKRIETLTDSMTELRSRNDRLLTDLQKASLRRKQFEQQFSLWRTWALQQSPGLEMRAALEKLDEAPMN